MLEVYQRYDRKGLHVYTQALDAVVPSSQRLREKQEGLSRFKSLEAMDDTVQHTIIATGQHRKDIDTASTSPESNSVVTDYRSGFAWKNNPYVSDSKDTKTSAGSNPFKHSSWESDAYAGAMSDSNTNSRAECSSEVNTAIMCKRMPDSIYNQRNDTAEESQRFKSSEAGVYSLGISDTIYAKTKRSNSFTGPASYSGDPAGQTLQQENFYETDSAYNTALPENPDVVTRFMTDLRRKRIANARYPNDILSYTNNKFVYHKGPLGFPTVFRDSQSKEVVRSESSTMPLTVFSAYSPSHIEENAIAVQPTDKVDMLARHNHWLYVRIAKSKRAEAVGKTGWIPEEAFVGADGNVGDAVWPLTRSKRFSVKVTGDSKREYEAFVIKFANAWQLFLTHSGKVASWICASADTPHADVYSVRTLLGNRLHEHHAVYARSLVKTLCDSLSTRAAFELDREVVLILAIDVHDESTETFKQIMEQLKDIFKMQMEL
ncbi:proteasome assembly chaperone 3, putative [Babesia ovis]|uniref:Proteasome assembly chaperone 3, putative n=1 Tax=Babesia ovis TaxID=5869 RepID=A0A9W5TB00_BABOV|nr:proteasome assembly chaperone 3, putative [Babesia ovis]